MRLCVMSSPQLQVALCVCWYDLILGYITMRDFSTQTKMEKLALPLSFSAFPYIFL